MKTAGWYFRQGTRRIWAATKAEIAALAQTVADKTGAPVTVRRGAKAAARSTPAKSLGTRPAARPMKRNPAGGGWERGDDWTGVRCWATVNPRTGKISTTHAYKSQAQDHARKWGLDLVPAHWEAGKLILDGASRAFRGNPDPAAFMDVWRLQNKARADRLARNKATKGRRLAKGLRGADRGGQVKAAERQAQKTGKFAVHAKGRRDEFTLYRASRSAAEKVAAEFKAAGYRVDLQEI